MDEIVLGFWEFVGMVLGIILLVLLIFILAYEYKLWRARRSVKALIRKS